MGEGERHDHRPAAERLERDLLPRLVAQCQSGGRVVDAGQLLRQIGGTGGERLQARRAQPLPCPHRHVEHACQNQQRGRRHAVIVPDPGPRDEKADPGSKGHKRRAIHPPWPHGHSQRERPNDVEGSEDRSRDPPERDQVHDRYHTGVEEKSPESAGSTTRMAHASARHACAKPKYSSGTPAAGSKALRDGAAYGRGADVMTRRSPFIRSTLFGCEMR
jgi:hypothetical protein